MKKTKYISDMAEHFTNSGFIIIVFYLLLIFDCGLILLVQWSAE